MDDGTIRYVHENRKPYLALMGALRITGTVQDITEQRLSENHLKFINLVLKTQWMPLRTVSWSLMRICA